MEGEGAIKGSRQDSEQTAAVAKQHKSKALGVMTNWDQDCRRVRPDLLGALPLGVSIQL